MITKVLTQEQANALFEIIDADANLVGHNLQLKDVPEYYEWSSKYEEAHPYPEYDYNEAEKDSDYSMKHNKLIDAHEDARDGAWEEVVNNALLEENIIGACVIGGLTIAAMKAGTQVRLIDLLSSGTRELTSAIGLGSLKPEVVHALQEFTGLTFDHLYDLQRINDGLQNGSQEVWDYVNEVYTKNPAYEKTPEEATIVRRQRLKEYVQATVMD